MFICIEGPDGSGKSSQSKALAEWLGAEWRCFPDRRTPIGKLIDAHLKQQWSAVHTNGGSPLLGDDSLKTDALMFQGLQLANRAEVAMDILRTLRSGKHVVCDRYWGSGYAYGKADGLDPDYLVKIHEYLPEPALNVLIDVPTEVSVSRMASRGGKVERYEGSVAFLERVAENYRELWSARKSDPRWVVLDGTGSFEDTQKRLRNLIPSSALNK